MYKIFDLEKVKFINIITLELNNGMGLMKYNKNKIACIIMIWIMH